VLRRSALQIAPIVWQSMSRLTNEEGRLPPEPPLAPDPDWPRQAARAAAFFRRRENAAAAPAPNSTIIDGSGTLVPELEPEVVVVPHLWP